MTHRATRRTFLRSSAALAAATTLPNWFLDRCRAEPEPERPTSKNDTPGIALVGCGGMGRGDLKNAARFGRVVALCDVDEGHVAAAGKDWPGAARERDFRKVMERKDVDVVVCGTPDHWHTLVSLAAMRAGKDVYCEKPLSRCVAEGRAMVRAARDNKRVVQCGIQRLSSPMAAEAAEVVRSGGIGKVTAVRAFHVQNEWPKGIGNPPNDKPPEGVDWDAVQKVYEQNQKRHRITHGGSTITQQLAKNLFLSGTRSYLRKGQELIITYMLEALMGKEYFVQVIPRPALAESLFPHSERTED